MSQPEERRQVIQAIKAFADHTQTILGVAIGFFVMGVIAFGVRDAMNSNRKALALPTAVKERTLDSMAVIRKAVGVDHQGRQADFEFIVFPRTVRWAFGATDTVLVNNRRLDASRVPGKLLTNDVQQQLAGANSILALASTSTASSQIAAAQIAGKRAATVADWLTYVVPIKVPVYELNLGHYHWPCARCDTQHISWRDSVVLVVVRKAEWRTAVGEALKNALSKPRNLPSPSRFSTFAIVRHNR